MSVLKCKMCGGDLEVLQGMSVCECMYCGSRQTLPKMGSEKKNNLYDRASHFRRNNEYDKAMAIYEQILNEESEDSETYWSILLCRYGIEYVEDPATHKRVPTVNRAQMTSIYVDEDYKAAIRYADEEQKTLYEAEAKEIDRLQKGILEISSKEEPFDVFICYKESDAGGKRTEDSVLANDLYHQLTQEGFRVFFARITLEDKLGVAYEPYIFAALNSAKVMVVLGTKPEHFNAVWVKNEWSRYLALIRGGAKKILIPAYKNMDPYDLPEEFSHLQAQDMSKLGFMQDLIRGIKKLAEGEKKPQETASPVNNSVQPLIERAFLFLEDGDFARADELCEQALNQDPQNARAYVGKLMAERQINKQGELSNGTEELSGNNYFQKALRFAEDALREELERCNEMIVDRKKEGIYREARQFMTDSENAELSLPDKIKMMQSAINNYNSILGFREGIDTDIELAEKKKQQFQKMLEDVREQEKIQQERKKKKMDFALFLTGVGFLCLVIITQVIVPKINYRKAYKETQAFIEEGRYNDALSSMKAVAPEEADGMVDEMWNVSIYEKAVDYKEAGDFLKAKELFDSISTYEDSAGQSKECHEMWQESVYQQAVMQKDTGEYLEAKAKFDSISTYKDSEEQSNGCYTMWQESVYQQALAQKDAGEYLEAKAIFESIEDYEDSIDQSQECYYLYAMTYKENENYGQAINVFKEIKKSSEYKSQIWEDCDAQMEECQFALDYERAMERKDWGQYWEALKRFMSLKQYADSPEQVNQCRILGLQNAKAGDYVLFTDPLEIVHSGYYNDEASTCNPDYFLDNWRVLEIKDGKALIATSVGGWDRLVDDGTEDTWEISNDRLYFNNQFYGGFLEEERKLILKTVVSTPDNPVYGTEGGNDTEDYLFLLSIQEVEQYFPTSDELKDFVEGCHNGADGGWLRSPGENQRKRAYVHIGSYKRDGEPLYLWVEGIERDYSSKAAIVGMWITLNP